jgi:excisionase family DNA binding protein
VIVGAGAPAVILSARTAAWLERYAGLTSLRVRVRGTDPEISRELEDLRRVAMSWRGSACGTTVAPEAEPAAVSPWLSTGQAAALVELTPRAIRKAIAQGRLKASDHGGRWRVSREDLEHFRATRSA